MSGREGLNVGERAVDSAGASMLVGSTNEYGIAIERWIQGELVLTDDRVVFLESTGIFKTGRSRHHAFPLSSIIGTRIEKRGLTGSLTGEEFIVFDIDTNQGVVVEKHSCYKGDAQRLRDRISANLEASSSYERLKTELVRLIKPRGEIHLREVSQTSSVMELVAKGKRKLLTDLTPEETEQVVNDTVHSLISDGVLDGIVTEEGKFVSNLMLSRKTVQYQIALDFSSVFSRLKDKGIVLETLECPSCKGKLDYPENGSILSCKYCGALVTAVDVFGKFKGLLDI